MIKVGLDIGNSKISCIVCDIKNNQKPEVLSFISLPTSNINKNTFRNFNSIKKEVQEVINLAAKESQTEIKSINLNIPISDSDSEYYASEINIENKLINELHLKKAINQSEFFDEVIDKHILMNFIINYELDGKVLSEMPIGNFAKKLKINLYKLTVNQNIINTYNHLFQDLNIHIQHMIPTPLSSALSAMNDDDMDLGGVCIDLGDSSTSITMFENKKLIFCDSISIGSRNITKDIARGVSTTLDSAERLKTLYGSVLTSPSDEFEIIEVPIGSSHINEFKQINRSTINMIIKPRVEETLELVWQKLKQYDLNKKRIKNLILTGGGSQLEGISDYAQIIFDSNVRLGRPYGLLGLNRNFTGPQFSQTIGAVFFQESHYELKFLKKTQNIGRKSLIGRFSSWLDQYI